MILGIPKPGDFIVILKEVRPTRDGQLRVTFHGRRTGQTTGNNRIRENIHWYLYPGEWYKITKIVTTPGYQSQYPVLSLSLHRSHRKRKWVKNRMADLMQQAAPNPDDIKFMKNTDRNIYVDASDANGKVAVVRTELEAVNERVKILDQQNPSNSVTLNRWQLIQKG